MRQALVLLFVPVVMGLLLLATNAVAANASKQSTTSESEATRITIDDGSLAAARAVSTGALRNMFNSSQIVNLTKEDGLILVDFWARRACPATNQRVDKIATRVENFLQRFVRQPEDKENVPHVFYALSGTEDTNYVKKDSKLRNRYWFSTKKNMDNALVLKTREILKRKDQKPSPIDLFPGPGCNGSTEFVKPDVRLHPAITIDYERDIMFDNRDFFDRIAKQGVKRLYYVGFALNLCVFHTRKFSAMEALLSKRFESIGIILELTLYTWGTAQPICERNEWDDNECTYEFAKWAANDLRTPIRPTNGGSGITFWETLSKA